MKLKRGLFGWLLFIGICVLLVMLLQNKDSQHANIPLGDFNRLLKDDRVAWVDVGHDFLLGEFKRDEHIGQRTIAKFRVPLPEGTTSNWAFTNWLLNNAGEANVGVADNSGEALQNIIVPLIPWILIFGFIWFFVFRQLRVRATAGPAAPTKVFVVNLPGAAETQLPPSETQA